MRRNKSEKILSVATKLISHKGFNGASFQDISKKAGLHKSTLFHYFKNKEELLYQILEKSVDEVSLHLGKVINNSQLGSEEKLKEAIYNHLNLVRKYSDNVNIYLNEFRHLPKRKQGIYLAKRKKYEKYFGKIIEEMQTKGYFKGLDVKLVTFGILGMLNWVVKWYKNDGPSTIEEISDSFYRMIISNSI